MFDQVRETYKEQLERAFKQAPWRRQTQSVATLAVVLFVMAVVGGFYLTVSAQAGVAGRDLQGYEQRKSELILENDQLRAKLASLQSVNRLAERAVALGYQPVDPANIEYIVVKNYPTATVTVAAAKAPAPAAPATLEQWLVQTFESVLKAGGGG